MYGAAAIPEDTEAMLSNQPKNQAPARRGFGLVVALCVGVLIGALGTALLTPAPTPAPRPVLAATENEKCLNTLSDMSKYGAFCTQERMNIIYERCLPGVKALPCLPES